MRTFEYCERKAWDAIELGVIECEYFQKYVDFLVEKYKM